MRIPILLVGCYTLLRDGIGRILSQNRFEIVASTDVVDDAIALIQPGQSPALMILITEDDPSTVQRQITKFRTWSSSGRILVVARQWQKDAMIAALQAGADGCILELSDCRAFVMSVELIMSGVCTLPPELLSGMLSLREAEQTADQTADPAVIFIHNEEPGPQEAARFSGQEQRILACLCEGDSNKVIARKLGVAEATVKVHVKAILRKIRVANRTQAAIWAINQVPERTLKKELIASGACSTDALTEQASADRDSSYLQTWVR